MQVISDYIQVIYKLHKIIGVVIYDYTDLYQIISHSYQIIYQIIYKLRLYASYIRLYTSYIQVTSDYRSGYIWLYKVISDNIAFISDDINIIRELIFGFVRPHCTIFQRIRLYHVSHNYGTIIS